MTKTKQAYSYNFDVVGSPTITDQGVASGFSASNYLQLQNEFNPSSNSWEINLEIETPSSIANGDFFDTSLSEKNGIFCGILNSKFFVSAGNGSQWLIDDGNYTVEPNKHYYIKFQFTGSEYALSVSEDGETYTDSARVSSSQIISFGVNPKIGYGSRVNVYFNGEIFLDGCYININGQRWWDALTAATFYGDTYQVRKRLPYQVRVRADGKWDFTGNQTFTTAGQEYFATMETYDGLSMDYIESYQSSDKVDFSNTVLPWKWQYSSAMSTNRYCLMPMGQNYENVTQVEYIYNFDVIGSPTINNETKVVSGFSTSNYLKLKEPFNPQSNTWEVRCKFTTGNDVSTASQILHSCKGSGSDGRFGIGLKIGNSSKFNFYCSSGGSSWLFDDYGTYTVLANTTYWIKFGWTGTEYYLDCSTDGENYTRDVTYSSTSSIYSPLVYTYVGIYSTSSMSDPFLGSIDLTETYIKINGSNWWVTEFTKGAKQVLDSSITKVGSPTISSDFVVSGFSTSNYLTTSNPSITGFDSNHSTWYFQFKTGSSVNSDPCFEGLIPIFIESSYVKTWNANVGSGVSLFSCTGSTDYWIKVVVNGSSRTFYYKTANNDWTQCYQANNFPEGTSSHVIITSIGYAPWPKGFTGTIDLKGLYVADLQGNVIWRAVYAVKETLPGCTYNFTDSGSATTLNCFAVNGDESIVLTPDNSYGTSRLLGTVSIPAHTVYTYNNGVWTEVSE